MYDETNNSCKSHGGILTEAGIVLETGETIKDGKIVELARRAKALFDSRKYDDYIDLVTGSEFMNLPRDQFLILAGTEKLISIRISQIWHH